MPKTGTFLQKWRVPFGFLFAAAFLILAQPTANTLLFGGIISLAGLLIRAWASGHIRKNQELAVSGPYAYTRNPLYFGSFLLVFGFAAASGSFWIGIPFVILFLAIYLPVMKAEVAEIRAIFGEKFDRYALAVPLFVPRLLPYRAEGESSAVQRFDSALYMRYREYRAAFGFAAAFGVLAFKAFYLR